MFTRLISLGEMAAATMAKIGPLEEQFKKLDDEMASLRRILVEQEILAPEPEPMAVTLIGTAG